MYLFIDKRRISSASRKLGGRAMSTLTTLPGMQNLTIHMTIYYISLPSTSLLIYSLRTEQQPPIPKTPLTYHTRRLKRSNNPTIPSLQYQAYYPSLRSEHHYVTSCIE